MGVNEVVVSSAYCFVCPFFTAHWFSQKKNEVGGFISSPSSRPNLRAEKGYESVLSPK